MTTTRTAARAHVSGETYSAALNPTLASAARNARLADAASELLAALRDLTVACANVRNTPEQLTALADVRALLARVERTDQ